MLEVRAMASVPYLVAGLQIAAPAAFLGALIGEFTGAERGLGVLTLRAMRSLDAGATSAIATISAVVSTAGDALAGQLGRWLWPGAPPILTVPPSLPGQTRYRGCGIALARVPAFYCVGTGSWKSLT